MRCRVFNLSSGEAYVVTPDGHITRKRGSEALWRGSDDWRITGAVRVNNFGHVVARYSLADLFAGDLMWRYKNGKPRIYLTDVDHGTPRQQCSPSVCYVTWEENVRGCDRCHDSGRVAEDIPCTCTGRVTP